MSDPRLCKMCGEQLPMNMKKEFHPRCYISYLEQRNEKLEKDIKSMRALARANRNLTKMLSELHMLTLPDLEVRLKRLVSLYKRAGKSS